MIKIFEAFAGYGSQSMALERLGLSYEIVGISEVDKFAIQAYNAVHPDVKNYGDITQIDWTQVPDFNLFTYSFPCQDISMAGKQQGLEEGSGTRSSLLWECKRAIENKMPGYLLMENVKALASKKFLPYLKEWENYLSSLGYHNYTKVLNAKNYGIPQSRERVFMVSILDPEQTFEFPEPIELKCCLADILEKNVDPKYDLSSKTLAYFERVTNDKSHGHKFTPKTGKDVAFTIRTRPGQRVDDNFIKDIPFNKYITPETPIGCAMRGRRDSPDAPITQRIEVGSDVANCITSAQKDSLIIEPTIMQVGNILPNSTWSNPQIGRVYSPEGISPTIDTMQGGGREPKILQQRPFRIRKLTEREVFRLMGVSDRDINKIQAAGLSKTQQFKMAGNSIVVDVLCYIFKNLFKGQIEG